MKMSQYFLPTVKETPADAVLISHQLMLRAGMIRKSAAGLYTWLPLGLRVLKKVENIVREEMNAIGALEILMPAVQPAELWQESGRWDQYGAELLRLKDRHQRDFCFGPTHEEIVTDLLRHELRSYKQLPVTVYQIQTKFRDEIRPRFGLMRAREFLMKDAYSFHITQDSLQQTYDDMARAYSAIFTRLGLDFRAVWADSGNIGGQFSQEFHVLAESGEDTLAYCEESDYAANVEKAESFAITYSEKASGKAIEKFATPNARTIVELSEQFSVPAHQSVKTLIVKGETAPMVALILRGDHTLNPLKAEKLDGVASPLELVAEETVREVLKCGFGSLGPVNLTIPVIVDRDCAGLVDFVCGANEEGFHFKYVNWGRDVKIERQANLREVVAGDRSPDNKGDLKIRRGIEVGHIFQLGNKYTLPMQASVLDEQGKSIPLLMGCYGIGVSRTVAAAIEQNYDDKGICWPDAMAPFQVVIVPVLMHKSYRVREVAEKLYNELKDAGVEVLIDDRKERPGVMFSDMDLIGIPHRVVVSERGIDAGTVEYKARRDEEDKVQTLGLDAVVAFLADKLAAKV